MRRRIMDRFDDADLADLPPVPLPPAPELLDAAARSAALRAVTGLVTWVGAGRPLGRDGRLTAGDADELCLTTGRPLRNADGDGEGLEMLMRWATAAGLVRTLKGRLVPVRSRSALIGRPVELWEHLLTGFAEVGRRGVADGSRFTAPLWHHWPDMFELVKLSLYTAGGGQVPVEMLLEITLDAPVGMAGFAPYAHPTPATRRAWHTHLLDALAALEWLGAIRTELSGDPDVDRAIREISGRPDPDLTLAALTPIGLWAVNRWLVAHGVPAPVVGDSAGTGLFELFERLTTAGPEVVDAELACWVDHRGPARAATEVESFLRVATEPAQRLFAVPVLTLSGEHGTAAAHRLRAAGGLAGSIATGWLLATDAIEVSDTTRQETMPGVVDELSALAAAGFVAQAFDGYPVPEQITMVIECVGTGHPRLPELLEAIAGAPVHPKVAKAARKARSRLPAGPAPRLDLV